MAKVCFVPITIRMGFRFNITTPSLRQMRQNTLDLNHACVDPTRESD